MKSDRDPVDSALYTLRSESWTAGHHNLELEEKLMQEFTKRQAAPRSAKFRTLLVALGILTIGGVTFAATGGVERLKNWFVKIEINGEVTEVALDENGENTFTVDTEDGGTATVHIQKSSHPDEESTRIQVTKQGGDENQEEVEVIKKRMVNWMPQTYAPEVLGDAEALTTWRDETGSVNELFILPSEEGPGSRIFLATTMDDDQTMVTLVAEPPVSLLDGDSAPQVTVGDDGMLTITLQDDAGNEREMKLVLRRSFGEPGELGNIDIDAMETPDGSIKIQIEESDEDL